MKAFKNDVKCLTRDEFEEKLKVFEDFQSSFPKNIPPLKTTSQETDWLKAIEEIEPLIEIEPPNKKESTVQKDIEFRLECDEVIEEWDLDDSSDKSTQQNSIESNKKIKRK